MDVQPLLPGTEALACEQMSVESEQVTLRVRRAQASASCPDCHQPSDRVHSRYVRTLADLPWQGRPACLRVQVRRFFCDNRRCRRRTFAERLPEVAGVRARQTTRLHEAHQWLALACGGEGGSRLAGRLGMPISADSLLRRVRRLPDPPRVEPQVLGVDDWALRRGQRYGTILCDLERHCPIELLPERSSEALSEWLNEHQGVRVISRDRGDEYRKAATDVAPQAQQVADRWHLLHNLHEAVMREVDCHPRQVLEAARTACAEQDPPQPVAPDPAPAPAVSRKPTRAEQRKQARRARRLRRYEQVVELHEQGMSLRAIGKKLGMNRGTVRRFVRAGQFPERADRPSRNGADPFTAHLRQRWEAGCTNAATLFHELKALGFTGSYPMVRRKVAPWRDPARRRSTCGPKPRRRSKVRQPSSRRIAWLLLKEASALDPEERRLRRKLRTCCPSLRTAASLGRWFTRLVRQRRADRLDAWLARACTDHAPLEVRSFAQGLLQDLLSVTGALRMPWSNGQVEGQINRLKLVKRQMYGRANFDLLRARFLHAA